MFSRLAQFTDVQVALAVGGLPLAPQAAALRAAPEVVVATPGRLVDHLRNSQGFGLESLAALVLDEADRLLEMGFAEEVREIVRAAPPRRQTLLFSATMTEEVRALAAVSLRSPVRLAADAAAAAPGRLTQEVVRLRGAAAAQKEATLLALAARALGAAGRTIVFFKTKARAHRARVLFGLLGLPPAAELHGDMTQAARLAALESFRRGDAAFLLATDVAARGLDILGVETVVNYDAPAALSSYLHRVGRTARAGARGRSVTFVEDCDRALLKEVVRRGGAELRARAVPPAAVARWQRRLEGAAGAVARVAAEERAEGEARRAEMEAAKATNLLEHGDAIAARPARTWFQSEREKKAAAAAARAHRAAGGDAYGFAAAAAGGLNAFGDAAGDGDSDGAGAGGPSKKQQKGIDKSAKRSERKAAVAKAATEEARAAKKGRNALMEETAATKGRVRAVKARAAALREEGVPSTKAGRLAAAAVTGVKRKSKKAKRAAAGGGGGEGGGEGGLFEGDGVAGGGSLAAGGRGAPRVYAGGPRSGAVRAPAPPRPKKAGGKGAKAFKSKGRHKRKR